MVRLPARLALAVSAALRQPLASLAMAPPAREYYRHDGVRITHDPYAPGMAEKYGAPGKTDNEGFDPYRDSVGAGIYGGRVQRDELGRVVIGRQYQNHNPRPGPVYAGGGYAPVVERLANEKELRSFLEKFPDMANSVTTGGAQPLHMCGMAQRYQRAVASLVDFGADVEALDSYGMTPLHRMASNNLPEGARLLLERGADPTNTGEIRTTPAEMARESRSSAVLQVLEAWRPRWSPAASMAQISRLEVDAVVAGESLLKGQGKQGGPSPELLGVYLPRPASEVPKAFAKVCAENRWDAAQTWRRLNGDEGQWYKKEDTDGYIYYNRGDGKWWLDAPDGLGVYIVPSKAAHAPPAHGWRPIDASKVEAVMPELRIFRGPSGGEL